MSEKIIVDGPGYLDMVPSFLEGHYSSFRGFFASAVVTLAAANNSELDAIFTTLVMQTRVR